MGHVYTYPMHVHVRGDQRPRRAYGQRGGWGRLLVPQRWVFLRRKARGRRPKGGNSWGRAILATFSFKPETTHFCRGHSEKKKKNAYLHLNAYLYIQQASIRSWNTKRGIKAQPRHTHGRGNRLRSSLNARRKSPRQTPKGERFGPSRGPVTANNPRTSYSSVM